MIRLDEFKKLMTRRHEWETKKVKRSLIENKYANYTGLIHAIELHVPYTKYDLLTEPIVRARDYKGKKLCILNGDTLNFDMFSMFFKTTPNVSDPIDEVKDMIDIMKVLTSTYDEVLYLLSNHDQRMKKIIYKNFPDKQMATALTMFLSDVTDYLQDEGIKNATVVDNVFVMLGDTIFCHMEKNSTVPGSISRDMVSYFKPRIQKDFNAIYQSHTHGQSTIPIDRVLFVETGCLADTFDYWRNGKLQGVRKMSSLGYGEAIMNRGKIDIRNSRAIPLAWEGWL